MSDKVMKKMVWILLAVIVYMFFIFCACSARAKVPEKVSLLVAPVIGSDQDEIFFGLWSEGADYYKVNYCWLPRESEETTCELAQEIKIRTPENPWFFQGRLENGFYRFQVKACSQEGCSPSSLVKEILIDPYFQEKCFEGQLNFYQEEIGCLSKEEFNSFPVLFLSQAMKRMSGRQLGCFLSCLPEDDRCRQISRTAAKLLVKSEKKGGLISVWLGKISGPSHKLVHLMDTLDGIREYPSGMYAGHADYNIMVSEDPELQTIVLRMPINQEGKERIRKRFQDLNIQFWSFVSEDQSVSNPYSYNYGLSGFISLMKAKAVAEGWLLPNGAIDYQKIANQVAKYYASQGDVLSKGEEETLEYILSLPVIPEYSFRKDPLAFSREEADYDIPFETVFLPGTDKINPKSSLFRRELYCSLLPFEWLAWAYSFEGGSREKNWVIINGKNGKVVFDFSKKFVTPGDLLVFLVRDLGWEVVFSDVPDFWSYGSKKILEQKIKGSKMSIEIISPETIREEIKTYSPKYPEWMLRSGDLQEVSSLSWEELIDIGLSASRALAWNKERREAQKKSLLYSIKYGALERQWNRIKIKKIELNNLFKKI